MKKQKVKILFIGNSHTYVNDLPAIVQKIASEEGCEADVVMIAHGGWYLKQHVQEPDVAFNIRYGQYDYVVLQEHSHPFDCIEDYQIAAAILTTRIQETGSTPVIFETWAMRDQESEQARMKQVNRESAESLGAVYAPVGESWFDNMRTYPKLQMYAEDGAHAAAHGGRYAAKIIWSSIRTDITRKKLNIKR